MLHHTLPKQRVAYWLKWQIFSGAYPAGTILPAAHEIAHKFNINVNTVLSALRILQQENLIDAGRGKDSRVIWTGIDGGFERARALLETIEEDCRKLNISVEEFAGAVAMRRASALASGLSIWYVDADHPNFSVLLRTLRRELSVDVYGVKLEDIEAGNIKRDELSSADIIFAPVYHREVVASIFSDVKGVCIPLVAKLSWASYSRLFEVPDNKSVAIACKSEYYASISKRVLARSGLFESAPTCSLENIESFMDTLRSVDLVAASPPASEYVSGLGDEVLSNKIIPLHYDFDRDSIASANIYIDKVTRVADAGFR